MDDHDMSNITKLKEKKYSNNPQEERANFGYR
jgi:hypothetical protein